jgi:hypothetical protein
MERKYVNLNQSNIITRKRSKIANVGSNNNTDRRLNLRERKNTSTSKPKEAKITRKWSPDEDYLLLKLCNSKLTNKWKSIAYIIGNKISSQCSYRYAKLKNNGMAFSDKEDILLTDDKIKLILSKRRTNRMRFIKHPSKIFNSEDNTIPKSNKQSETVEKEINLNESLVTNFLKPVNKFEDLTKGIRY